MSQFDELPEGWVGTTLKDIVLSIQYGHTASAQETRVGPRILRITDLQNNSVNWKSVPFCICEDIEKYALKKGDIVIARTGATTGKSFLLSDIPEETVFASYLIRLSTSDLFPPEYIGLFLQSPAYWDQITVVSKGTAQPGANAKILSGLEIALPPLNEQRRIVEKIEALTARSRKAREALEAIPELLAQFRQSVLAAAFRGDLTADWREQNPDVEPTWKLLSLSEVIYGKPRNGYSPKSVDYPTAVKSLSLSATTSGIFQSQHFKYIDEVIADDSHLWLTPGDILIQRSNTIEYVGTSAIYDGEPKEFIYPDLMMKIQVIREKVIPEFIHICLSAEQVRRYFKSKATGTAGNMPKINQKTVLDTPIPTPSIAEQKEAIRQVHQYLSILEKVRVEYEELITDAEQLDRSILAKAFRGELVPQDSNDEPAAVLLERIRAERINSKGKIQNSKKRKQA